MLTVGEELRRKREEKGLSIKDVVDGTYIQAKFIIALECNDYSVFPAEVYTKGFLKNYAELLGLDAQQILELFKNTKDQVTPLYDQDYYKTAYNLEPDVQKVVDPEGRKTSIQEAIAAKEDLNYEPVKVIRIEQEVKNEEPIAIELDNVDIAETIEEKPETCIEELSLETDAQKSTEPTAEVQKVAVSLEDLVEEARREPTAFTDEEQIVDNVPLVKRKQDNIEQEDNDVVEQLQDIPKPDDTECSLQQTSFKQKLVENRNNGKSKTKTVLIIVFLLIALASAYLMLIGKGGGSSTDNTGQKSSGINIFKPATSEKQVQVQIIELTGKVNARCWVSIVADGKTIFEDNLQPGTTFKWPAKESLKVTIGNVNALTDLKLNGKTADLGQVRNNVVEKTFSLKDVK